MIITVKNLQQQTFTIDFDPEKTVFQLKEKIYNERGPEYVVGKQKLIYAGVILDDKRTIASYNIDENKFVVVMLKRDIGNYVQKPDESGASTSATLMTPDSETLIENLKEHNIGVQNESKAKTGDNGSSDEDTKSVGSGGSDSSGGGAVLGPVGSNTSILSSGSGASLLSGSSIGSGGSETSHSTYSSGDLAGVFSNTSLQSRAESNLLMGDEYNRTVESMIEMGYCREMVERAMAASFNNPERAVEYLISGIPETPDRFNASTAAVGESDLLRSIDTATSNEDNNSAGDREVLRTSGDDGGGDGSVNQASGSGDNLTHRDGAYGEGQSSSESHQAALRNVSRPAREDPFEFLRSQPQFLQMRSLVYQNPDLLHAVLQQIGQTNPALLQLISENQDAFLSMLNQPMEGQTGTNRQYPRRMTPGRRAQLAAAARAAAGGDGLHIRSLDTAPGAGGDGPLPRQRPAESGDAGADTIPHDILPPRPDRAAERRAAAADAFMRERAAAAAAVAALTAAASAAVQRDAGGGEGGSTNTPAIDHVPDSGVLEGGADGEGAFTIRLTPQDQDAIERLKALGFPETLVLQAYFACDKDEQLAANFLISSAFDD